MNNLGYDTEHDDPKRREKRYSYDESLDEAPELIDEEPVDIEQETPADENEPIEGDGLEEEDLPPAFLE